MAVNRRVGWTPIGVVSHCIGDVDAEIPGHSSTPVYKGSALQSCRPVMNMPKQRSRVTKGVCPGLK